MLGQEDRLELVALGARGLHSCLLDANNFRLLKIVKHNLILLGRSLGLTVLSLYALAADSMRLLLSALTSFKTFFLAEDEHVERSNPRVLSVHCCWQVES